MAETDADTASMLKHMIQDPLDMIPYFRIAIFAFSGVLVVIASVLWAYWRKKSREHLYTKLESTEREPLSRNSKIQEGTTDEPSSFRKDNYGATPGQILHYNSTAGQTSNNVGSTFNQRSEDEGETSSDHKDSIIDESLYFDPQSPERTNDNSYESV